jgi:hypothetical protein
MDGGNGGWKWVVEMGGRNGGSKWVVEVGGRNGWSKWEGSEGRSAELKRTEEYS